MNDILKDTHIKSSDFLVNRELIGVFNMYFFAVEAQEFLIFHIFLKMVLHWMWCIMYVYINMSMARPVILGLICYVKLQPFNVAKSGLL